MIDPASTSANAIAIIGLACRLPGAADPTALWRLLCAGRHALRDTPADRWPAAAYVDHDRRAPGKMVTARGGYLDAVDGFDPEFFGISPREATQIDPQQRLSLELAWEALEHAGVRTEQLRGTNAGVFMGAMWADYEKLHALDEIEQHSGTGWHLGVIPGRVSHVLGLRGPSIAINTACSSSLVAVHLACQALREHECTLALAGGVSLMLAPHVGVAMSKFGGTSRSGDCFAYDARADGYVRGEGGGMLVLRRYADALAAGDHIIAVIHGSGVNNDGEADGLTVPSELAQRQLLRDVYARAGVDPRSVAFVEGHGTGTAVGDPIEARAVGSVLGRAGDRPGRAQPLWLASLKPNIGHTEAASGVASLIKAALSLDAGLLPPNRNFEQPNPEIDFEGLCLRVPTQLASLPAHAYAGVNSFGFGGTNCHVILSARAAMAQLPATADPRARANAGELEPQPRLFAVSGHSLAALDARLEQLRALVERHAQAPKQLDDLAHTLWHRRTALEHRAAMVASTPAELIDAIERGPSLRGRSSVGRARPKLVWMFSGQGSQWLDMGRELLGCWPAFAAALAQVSAAIEPLTGVSLLHAIAQRELGPQLEYVDGIQPAIYAMQVALAQTWSALGLRPDVVVGHSMGEVAAAVAAGAISVEDGARITCSRARLLRRISGRGGMLSLALDAAATEALLARNAARYAGLGLAVDAGAGSSVVSGDLDALARLRQDMLARAIECRAVAVDVAAHSPQIDALADELLAEIADVRARPTEIEMMSSVTGAAVHWTELTPRYWVRNLRERVRFAEAAERLLDADARVFLELSPHPLLTWPLAQIAKQRGKPVAKPGGSEAELTVVGSMRRARSERAQLLEAIAALHCRGFELALAQAGELLELPSYPWQRRRFWPQPRAAAPATAELAANVDVVARFDRSRVPELDAHTVSGRPIVSAGVMLELMLRGALMLEPGAAAIELERVEFAAPIAADAAVRLELSGTSISLRPSGGPACVFARLGCAARLETGAASPARSGLSMSGEQHLRALAERGVDYGPQLRAIESLTRGPNFARVRVHPGHSRAALLDAALQAVLAAVEQPGSFVTARIEHARIDAHALTSTREIHVELEPRDGRIDACASLLDDRGVLLASLTGVRLTALQRAPSVLQRRSWRALQTRRSSAPDHRGRWLLLGPEDRGSAAVLAALREHGVDVQRVDQLTPALEFEHLLVSFAGGSSDTQDPFEATTQPCARLIRAIRACADARSLRGHAARVWVISERAQAIVAGESTVLGSSALAALARVAEVELPGVGVRVIDVGDLDDASQRRALASELGDREGPQWLALRRNGPHCDRLVPVLEPEPVPSQTWRAPAGTVIVSGGLGGIGRAVVAWLVERGVERVVILGRSALEPDTEAFLAELGPHTQLRYLAVDVADLDALREALHDELPHTIGVIHSAAVASNAPLIEQHVQLLREALRPKLLGAWNLHTLTAAHALEFFVMFGSLGGWVGLPGQSSYAAANAALDGLAEHRRALGLPAINIGWCGWEGLGLARTAGGAASLERLAAQGMGALAPTDALALLDHLVAGTQVCPVIAVMPPVAASHDARPSATQQLAALRELAPARRRAELGERVMHEVAAVLREDAQRIDPTRALRDLGLDSLMSVELGERLNQVIGVETSTTLIWQHPSVDALVAYFDAAITPTASPSAAQFEREREREREQDSLLAELDALSDDDVEALLGAV